MDLQDRFQDEWEYIKLIQVVDTMDLEFVHEDLLGDFQDVIFGHSLASLSNLVLQETEDTVGLDVGSGLQVYDTQPLSIKFYWTDGFDNHLLDELGLAHVRFPGDQERVTRITEGNMLPDHFGTICLYSTQELSKSTAVNNNKEVKVDRRSHSKSKLQYFLRCEFLSLADYLWDKVRPIMFKLWCVS